MNEMNNNCITIQDEDLVNLNSQNYLEKHNFRVPWDLLLEMKLSFSITTKTMKRLGPISGPECFKFRIDINFVNDDHDGQVIFTIFFNIFLRVVKYLSLPFTRFWPSISTRDLRNKKIESLSTKFLQNEWCGIIMEATIDMLTTP